VGVFRTGHWLLKLPAREFFEKVICRQLAPSGIVEGPNFAFGHDRGGNVASLGAWCEEAGIDFEIVEGTSIEGRLISSSLIRGCLSEGRVEDAARFLGRPHRIRGTVSPGARRGATLGFPTINLANIDAMIPAPAVYAGLAYIEGAGRPWPAACNLGPNPTFGEQATKVEAHLIGFAGDLYCRRVEIEFLKRLRSIRAFSGRDELLRQIQLDVDDTRNVSGAGR
jgi:riboflavin kinase/FMN adenylyltransferase